LALDPSSFTVVHSHEEYCGQTKRCRCGVNYFNITRTLRRIPGHDGASFNWDWRESPDHLDRPRRDPAIRLLNSSVSVDRNHAEASNSARESQSGPGEDGPIDGSEHPQIESGTDIPTIHEHDRMDVDHVEGDEDGGQDQDRDGEDGGLDDRYNDSTDGHDDNPCTSARGAYSERRLNYQQLREEANPDTAGIMLYREQVKSLPFPYLPRSRPTAPSVPVLHLSGSHLYLFDGSKDGQSMIHCHDLLSFQKPAYYSPRADFINRLNMTQYVPDLGVVVIATQIGRAAVCSLTRAGFNGPFGLRLDWILPFEWQEKNEDRPLSPLLGIAVGPVQGHEFPRARDYRSGSDGESDNFGTRLRDRTDEDNPSVGSDPELTTNTHDSRIDTEYDSQSSEAEELRSPRSGDKDVTDYDDTLDQPTQPSEQVHEQQILLSPSTSHAGFRVIEDREPFPAESWSGIEYSRRYRLMLTYADHMVLTYELSRAPPYVGDEAHGRRNWRNKEEFY
jgi:hypothetical protein